MSWNKELSEILQKKKSALQQGGEENVRKQHAKGLLTIRERIALILDDNTFDEIGPSAGGSERDKNGNLIIFKHSQHLELDARLLGMNAELYGVSRSHNSASMNIIQDKGRLSSMKGTADKNNPRKWPKV